MLESCQECDEGKMEKLYGRKRTHCGLCKCVLKGHLRFSLKTQKIMVLFQTCRYSLFNFKCFCCGAFFHYTEHVRIINQYQQKSIIFPSYVYVSILVCLKHSGERNNQYEKPCFHIINLIIIIKHMTKISFFLQGKICTKYCLTRNRR